MIRLDAKGRILPRENPGMLTFEQVVRTSARKLEAAKELAKIPDAPEEVWLEDMEELIAIAEEGMPVTFIDEEISKNSSATMAIYRSKLKAVMEGGGTLDKYQNGWNNELEDFFKLIHLHYIAKMTPQLQAMKAEDDPVEKAKLKADLASDLRGFILDRMGRSLHHCTNRMNRSLKSSYFDLIVEDLSRGSVHAKIDIQLLTLRRRLLEEISTKLNPADIASFMHHQEIKHGAELGLGVLETSSSDTNYSEFGGTPEQSASLKAEFQARYTELMVNFVLDDLRQDKGVFSKGQFSDWFEGRFNKEDAMAFLYGADSKVTKEAVLFYLRENDHIVGADKKGATIGSLKDEFMPILLEAKDVEGFRRAIHSPDLLFQEISPTCIDRIMPTLSENLEFIDVMKAFIAESETADPMSVEGIRKDELIAFFDILKSKGNEEVTARIVA